MEIGQWFKWVLVETFSFISLLSCLIKDLLSAWSLDFIDMLFVKKKCIKDQIVLITGGAGGIGRALGKKMAEMGAKKGINEAVRELENHGLRARAFSCDCTSIDQLRALAERIKSDGDLGK
uniref:Uncharacterized protein n=1 Tax=Romanomermis culicivorax TaxID=13658 RepID=A0A915J2G4_ROMCU